MSLSSFFYLNKTMPTFLHSNHPCGTDSALDLTFSSSNNITFQWGVRRKVHLWNSHNIPITLHSSISSSPRTNGFIPRKKFLDSLTSLEFEPNMESIQNTRKCNRSEPTYRAQISFLLIYN